MRRRRTSAGEAPQDANGPVIDRAARGCGGAICRLGDRVRVEVRVVLVA